MKLLSFGGGRRINCETVDEAKALVVGVSAVAVKHGHTFSLHRNDKCEKCGALIVRLAHIVYVLPKMVEECKQ